MFTVFTELPDEIRRIYHDHRNILTIRRSVNGDGIVYRIYLYGGVGQCWHYDNGWKCEIFRY